MSGEQKKKSILEYAKPQPKKSTVDEIVEWFVEEKRKKGEGSGQDRTA